MSKLAGDHIQIVVDGYDLTGDSNSLTVSDRRDAYDVTAFGDTVHKFIPGKRLVSIEHAGFMNTAAARSHPVLNGAAVAGVVSVLVGHNAAPASGDLMYSIGVRQGKYRSAVAAGSYVPFAANFANIGDLGGWGQALAALASFTTTSNGASVDYGAATTQGGAVFLHIVQPAASDTYSIVVEGSATGAFSGEQTTLATFSLNASARGSERLAIQGTIPRYARWKATRSGSAGDTVQIALNLVRF